VRLLPRDERFFELFTAVASLNVKAAQHFAELIEAGEERDAYLVDAIKKLEHEADDITHEVITRLDRSFITPLDREDIHMLASRLDNVLDHINGAARRFQIFKPGPRPEGADLMAGVIVRATQQILEAVKVMDGAKAPVVIAACTRIKELEEEGDAVYHEWMAKLFANEKDPINLIKWKELYDTLERTLDQAEDVANVLESIAIKHS
jgi:predicted phosphate transport protein (TIGR00153 family)